MCRYVRSAVNILSLANGALGEHRRHDTDAIKLEIAAPGCRTVSTRVPAEPAGAVCATPKDNCGAAVRGRMLRVLFRAPTQREHGPDRAPHASTQRSGPPLIQPNKTEPTGARWRVLRRVGYSARPEAIRLMGGAGCAIYGAFIGFIAPSH